LRLAADYEVFKSKKLNLHYTHLIPFWVSRVSGAQLPPQLCAKAHTIKVATLVSHW